MTVESNMEFMNATFKEYADALAETSCQYITEKGAGDPMKQVAMQAAIGKAMVICGTINLARSMMVDDEEMDGVRKLTEKILREIADYGAACKVGKAIMEGEGE